MRKPLVIAQSFQHRRGDVHDAAIERLRFLGKQGIPGLDKALECSFFRTRQDAGYLLLQAGELTRERAEKLVRKAAEQDIRAATMPGYLPPKNPANYMVEIMKSSVAPQYRILAAAVIAKLDATHLLEDVRREWFEEQNRRGDKQTAKQIWKYYQELKRKAREQSK